MQKRNQRGFTLMELMVVIVIVAILAAVAVPLYINYVRDAKRTEAKGAIAALISAAQVYYQKKNPPEYTGMTTTADSIRVSEITAESSRNWTYSFPTVNAQDFTVTAHGQGDAVNLDVTCIYSRSAAPIWKDTAP